MAEGRPKGSAERKGKASPLEAGRGKYSPGPRKGHFGSTEAKGQGCSLMKDRILHIINKLQKYSLQKSGNSRAETPGFL